MSNSGLDIRIQNAGKRFNFHWIFRNLDLHMEAGSRWVFLGSNGSGKSTLLQIVAGHQSLSEGDIHWNQNGVPVLPEHLYAQLSLAAPYLELIEEFSLEEHLRFHFSVKPPIGGMRIEEILELSGLKSKANLRIGYFSSGMKQRTKLLLAILSDTPLLLLDEPLSNLDQAATQWYLDLVDRFGKGRTIIVCSNSQADEFRFCEHEIRIGKA